MSPKTSGFFIRKWMIYDYSEFNAGEY
jgi:hypothetical protein